MTDSTDDVDWYDGEEPDDLDEVIEQLQLKLFEAEKKIKKVNRAYELIAAWVDLDRLDADHPLNKLRAALGRI